jgi:hypothetical protein
MFDPHAGPVRETQLYFHGSGQLQAIRQRQWKLFLSLPAGPGQKANKKTTEGKKASVPIGPALFNLRVDEGEATDVAAEHPEIVARLSKLALEMEIEIKAHKRPAGQHSDQ